MRDDKRIFLMDLCFDCLLNHYNNIKNNDDISFFKKKLILIKLEYMLNILKFEAGWFI